MKLYKFIFTLGLISFFNLGNAQVLISEEEGSVHEKAILQIDSHKGIMLPAADDFSKFPNYSESEPDLFTDDKTMEGMLMFNKADQKLYVFDGENWYPSNALTHRSKNQISLLKSTAEDIVKVIVLNITDRDIIPFNTFSQISDIPINNAYLEASEGDAEGTYKFTQSGWYKINPSIMVKSGGGVSVGNIEAVAILSASFKNGNNYSDWWVLMQHDFTMEGLLVTVGGSKAMNFEYVRYFNAGDKIKLEVSIRNTTGAAVGAGVTFLCNHNNTFLYVEKLD